MTKRQKQYNEIVTRCINILKENGFNSSQDLMNEWGDETEPAYYLLDKELKLIKRIFRNKSELAIASLYFHLQNGLDCPVLSDIYHDGNFNYYTVAGESIISLLKA